MDMGAASTSNHHQGYRNESREATQSQTAHIDCKASKYESLRSSQRQGGREWGERRGLAGEDLEEHQNEKRNTLAQAWNKIEGK